MKRKMTKLEASRLGTAAMRIAVAKLKQERIAEYNKHPVLCRGCNKPLTYEQKVAGNEFCSQSCSASHNNSHRSLSIDQRQKLSDIARAKHALKPIPVKKKLHAPCKLCGKPVVAARSDFCSTTCAVEYKWREQSEEISKTGVVPSDFSGETDTRKAKKFLEQSFGRKCSKCGASELNGIPIPLQLHHIDGDVMNSSVSNLVLLCPTCHAMTDNFSNRNNHRSTRATRKRYWSTKEDRRDLSVYRAELALADKPSGIFPINDIRDDMIPIEEQIEMGMLKPDFKP